MEIELNENKYNNIANDFFELEHKNQNIKNNPEFKKWYEKACDFVKKENLKRAQNYIHHYELFNDYSILTIEYCDNCIGYTICSHDNSFNYVKCNKCKTKFCLGCSKIMTNLDEDNGLDIMMCLKGYLKGFYLRFINRRSELIRTCACFHIMHIIFCLFFTSLYVGFISHFIGLNVHLNKTKENKDSKLIFYFIYSILRGFIMFPYIITFLPFMLLLLLPSIFSYTYYLYIFVGYVTAIWPGSGPLENVGNY